MATFSAEQLKAIETYANLGPTAKESEVADTVGVTRKTLWEWRKEREFCEAIAETVRKNLAQHFGGIFDALIRKAKTGQVPAAKLILEAAGMISEKHEVHIDTAEGYRRVVEEAERIRHEMVLKEQGDMATKE